MQSISLLCHHNFINNVNMKWRTYHTGKTWMQLCALNNSHSWNVPTFGYFSIDRTRRPVGISPRKTDYRLDWFTTSTEYTSKIRIALLERLLTIAGNNSVKCRVKDAYIYEHLHNYYRRYYHFPFVYVTWQDRLHNIGTLHMYQLYNYSYRNTNTFILIEWNRYPYIRYSQISTKY